MKANLELYQNNPEINGGTPANNNTKVIAAALKVDLESQSVPAIVSIQSSGPRYSIWGDSLNSNISTSVQNPATPIAQSYSSVLKNTTTQVNPPNASQTGRIQ